MKYNSENMRQVIRLTEGDLHRIVRRLMNEIGDTREGQYMLGKASKRADKNNGRRFDIGSNKFDDYAKKRREQDKNHSDQMEDDFYDGYEMAMPRVQYKEYASWQGTQKLVQQEEYWKKEFAGEIPVLNIKTDFQRPKNMSFKGADIQLKIYFQKIMKK